MVKVQDQFYFQDVKQENGAREQEDCVATNKLFTLNTSERESGPITFVQHELDNEVNEKMNYSIGENTSNDPIMSFLYKHKKRNMESLTASCMILFFMPGIALLGYAAVYQRQCAYECTCSTITGIYGGMNLLTSAVLLLLRLYHYAHATSLNYEKLSRATLIIIHIGFEVLFAIYAYKLYLLEKDMKGHMITSNLAVSLLFKIMLAFNMLQIIHFLYSEKKLFDYENLLRVLSNDCQSNGSSTIREVFYLPGVTDEELGGVLSTRSH